MSNIKFNRILTMTVIGRKADDSCGSAASAKPIFIAAELMIKCGFTCEGILSIGHNGLHKNIDTFELCELGTKVGVQEWFINNHMEVEDFYLLDCLYEDKVFTHAVINNIFRRLRVTKCWVHSTWQVAEITEPEDALNGG